MAFVLRVKDDDGADARFEFDGVEARLGRTADNDIVVKDTQASRNHARVYERNGICFLEDLQSANGTLHNGTALSAPMALKSGDELSIGVVTFVFEQKVEPKAHRAAGWVSGEEVQEVNTATELPPEAEASVLRVTQATGPPEPSVVAEPSTAASLAVPMPTRAERASKENQAPGSRSRSDETPRRSPPGSRQQGTGPLSAVAAERSMPAEPSRAASNPGTQAGPLTKFERLSPNTRFTIGSAVTALVIAAIAAYAMVTVRAAASKNKGAEPTVLLPSGQTLSQSFGLGPSVNWPRPDQKLFSFALDAPGPVVAVVHLQARDVGNEEVSLSLNGAAQGWLPADSGDAATRELEVVLSGRELKLREPNQLIFDNVKNPPGTEPWRIWNVWLEVVPMPPLAADALIEAAEGEMQVADDALELKDVAVGNLFKAWANYRHAWLKLESLEPRPADPYEAVRARLRELRPVIDALCNSLVLEVQTQLNANDAGKARAAAEEILRRFPTREHRCHDVALQYQQDLSGL